MLAFLLRAYLMRYWNCRLFVVVVIPHGARRVICGVLAGFQGSETTETNLRHTQCGLGSMIKEDVGRSFNTTVFRSSWRKMLRVFCLRLLFCASLVTTSSTEGFRCRSDRSGDLQVLGA
jgi:hypothetical protein